MKYDYIDGTNQETFNTSLDAILQEMSEVGEIEFVECLKCHHRQADADFYTCEACGHNAGLAYCKPYEPEAPAMVPGPGAPQYTMPGIAIPDETQLSLL